MKKAISLLIVLAVALSLGTVAFAATDYSDAVDNPVLFDAISSRAIRDNVGTSGVTHVTIGANELFIADTKAGVVVGTDTILKPNETYKFDVYRVKTGAAMTDTDANILAASELVTRTHLGSTGSVKFRTIKGSSSIQSTKVRTRGSSTAQTYYVEISTRNLFGTKLNDVEYELSAITTGTPAPTISVPTGATNTFQVGFLTIDDSETDVGEEGTIVIYNDAPVILKDQFSDIAKSANYKNVTFEGEEGTWGFTGKVAGMKDTNFYYDFDPDTDLLNKFPEQEFKFLTFRAGVNFPTTGEMRIDVSDVSDAFRSMYAYLYREGKLTEINGVYDAATDELVFRTNYLGKFIITNQRITDTSLIPEEELEDEEEEEPIVTPPGTNNPNTGAADSANVMVALGLVSLASAAAISRKRK